MFKRPRTEAEIKAEIQRLEALNQKKAGEVAQAAALRDNLEHEQKVRGHYAKFRCQFTGCNEVSSGPVTYAGDQDAPGPLTTWYESVNIKQCRICERYFCSLHFLPDSIQNGNTCECLNCYHKSLKRQAGETSWLDRLING